MNALPIMNSKNYYVYYLPGLTSKIWAAITDNIIYDMMWVISI